MNVFNQEKEIEHTKNLIYKINKEFDKPIVMRASEIENGKKK